MTLAEKAHGAIARLIQERTLNSGSTIVEQHLAERLGISRTPVRQALQRLEGEGLLVKTANRSYTVRKVDLKEYLQSLKVREIMEAEAGALSAERVPLDEIAAARQTLHEVQAARPYDKFDHWRSDDEVHGLMIHYCGNAVLSRLILSLRVTTNLFEIERLAERLEPDSRQHEQILNALEARDARAARKASAAHIRSLYAFALATVG